MSFSLIDCLSVGVDRMERTFEPMRKQTGKRVLQTPGYIGAAMAKYLGIVLGIVASVPFGASAIYRIDTIAGTDEISLFW